MQNRIEETTYFVKNGGYKKCFLMHCVFLCKCMSTTFGNQVAGIILPEAHFLLWKMQSNRGDGTAQT